MFFFRMLTFEGTSNVFTGKALPAVHVQYSWEAFWVPKQVKIWAWGEEAKSD